MLIIAHAPSPNTALLRDALESGAQSQAGDGSALRIKSPFDTRAEDVLAAEGVILFTTENFGYMSGALKDFFDRSFYALEHRTDGLPYVLAIRAGKDGTGTKRAVENICAGMHWKRAQKTLICRGDYRTGFEAQCAELGAAFAAGLAMGIY